MLIFSKMLTKIMHTVAAEGVSKFTLNENIRILIISSILSFHTNIKLHELGNNNYVQG